jgi:hypothetical protein
MASRRTARSLSSSWLLLNKSRAVGFSINAFVNAEPAPQSKPVWSNGWLVFPASFHESRALDFIGYSYVFALWIVEE